MKVAIAIMSSNDSASIRNTECQVETFIDDINKRDVKNVYSVYIYRGKKDGEECGIFSRLDGKYNEIICDEKDNILNTFEKTVWAYKSILGYDDFDVLVRCNISCYINIGLLDCALCDYENDLIICNTINAVSDISPYLNQLYPRGDFYIISRKDVDGALTFSDGFIRGDVKTYQLTHVDDVVFGMCLYEYKGVELYNVLKTVRYGFMPYTDVANNEIYPNFLSYRVKTIPPNEKCSGYGWGDNEYRKFDVEKMRKIHSVISNSKYKNIKMSNLIVPDEIARNCVLYNVKGTNIKISEAKRFLISRFV